MLDGNDMEDGRERRLEDELMRSVPVIRLPDPSPEADLIVREARFQLQLNGRPFVVVSCLPAELEALAVGTLATAGRLTRPGRVRVDVDESAARIDVHGTFPEPVTERRLEIHPDWRLNLETISDVMRVLKLEAAVALRLGDTRMAALVTWDGEGLLVGRDLEDDVAVDKVIGKAFLKGLDPDRCLICCASRLTERLASKVILAGIPVLASRAGPTTAAVNLAERCRLTLIGFARGQRLQVYAAPERLAR